MRDGNDNLVVGKDCENARLADRSGRRIKVLVLVKAAPQPSSAYGDTVCVAGVVLTPGPLRWVRLYPVPFRYMSGDLQFKKYDVIDVRVRDAGGDRRPESLKIDAQSLKVLSHVDGWRKRAPWIEPLAGPTMCDLRSAVRSDINSASLAAVRPKRVTKLEISSHPGWTAAERERFETYAMQGDIFRQTPARLLDPPRMRVHLRYECLASLCPGHRQTNIDWELTAMQHHNRQLSEDELERRVQERFFDLMYSDDRVPLLFVGNQEDVRRRGSFTLLGSYYPRQSDIPMMDAMF